MHNELGDYQDAYKKAWDLWIAIDEMLGKTCGSGTTEESMLDKMERGAREIEGELARICASMEEGS